MGEPLNAATRPSRLPLFTHIAVVVLLALSFVSGVLVWWGQSIQMRELESPAWLQGSLILHGGLNPFLCVLFGYLCCQHIRLGWQLKANLITGIAMEVVFAALILSGVGLYYAGAADWRSGLIWSHRIAGLAVPVVLAGHWIAARAWVKRISK